MIKTPFKLPVVTHNNSILSNTKMNLRTAQVLSEAKAVWIFVSGLLRFELLYCARLEVTVKNISPEERGFLVYTSSFHRQPQMRINMNIGVRNRWVLLPRLLNGWEEHKDFSGCSSSPATHPPSLPHIRAGQVSIIYINIISRQAKLPLIHSQTLTE